MALNRMTAVIGTAMLAPKADDPRSLEELLYGVVQDALGDANLVIEDIDGILVGSNDQFDGRAISIMAASGSVGGVDRDIMSTPSAGEHALVMATLRIASGLYETHLVVSWSPTEASSLSEAQRLGADPYFHRRLPMDESASAALQAAALSAENDGVHELARDLARLSRAKGRKAQDGDNRKSAPAGKQPWPLTDEMMAAPVTGAVAMVIASEDYVREKGIDNAAWITGMGWATEAGYLGDRDLTRAEALAVARDRAFETAGLSQARGSVDVVELTGASPYQELMVADVLGLSPKDKWKSDIESGLFTENSDLPINPSGGVISFNSVFCTGLARVVEAANQVRGKAGAHQVKGVKTALAHAASGFAMMYQAVLVLSAREEGAEA